VERASLPPSSGSAGLWRTSARPTRSEIGRARLPNGLKVLTEVTCSTGSLGPATPRRLPSRGCMACSRTHPLPHPRPRLGEFPGLRHRRVFRSFLGAGCCVSAIREPRSTGRRPPITSHLSPPPARPETSKSPWFRRQVRFLHGPIHRAIP
jgi:hypothetical protein